MSCTMLHAVPDPSHNYGFFAICQEDDEVGQIVRFASTDPSCQVVLEDADIGPSGDYRFTRLAVAIER